MVICTLQMATLLLLPLAISEDWKVVQETAYTRHKMEVEDKMEELWLFSYKAQESQVETKIQIH